MSTCYFVKYFTAALFVCLFLVWAFIFVVAPCIEKLPAVQPIAKFIETRGIDVGALYYTEVEEASVAELNMHNTINYTPQKQ
ncbi:MAG: hypothetical protein KJ826_09385 [Proteobacteria bacterium]|nr:hypothetical protein [Pseudomonadota bacterium]